ncbi:hypothetical protein HMPREF0322_03608 [Desulfitobacterium hafniense DP7]|uniref:Uncharacterized protein n=1 Tax=Desulfitobacterium hafniense DP7 TaxID=537010 RepID=G9XRL0_DESHA|nr:hypothetical protein HMPREF0322_03608 [Desulfitobacterium hafniense DP7]
MFAHDSCLIPVYHILNENITIDCFWAILFMLPAYDTLLAFALCLISWPDHFLND